MNLEYAQWEPQGTAAPDGLRVRIAGGLDKGTCEDLYWVPATRTMYMHRWWAKNSIIAAGEVWYRLKD